MSIVLKKRLLAIGAALIFALSGSTVLAGSYHLGVFTKNKGYEAGREIKNQGNRKRHGSIHRDDYPRAL